MPFQPGHKLSKGRPKGSTSKQTLRLVDRLNELGIDCVERLVELIPQLTPKEAAGVYSDLLQYQYSKLKSVEVSGEVSNPQPSQQITTEQMLAMVKAARGDYEK